MGSGRLARGLAVYMMASLAVLFSGPNAGRSTGHVDLVLVLALDVSNSVDADEFDLQKTGLANAFRHPAVVKAITSGRSRRIAVTAVQWAGVDEQTVSVPWTVVGGATSAAAFADLIDGVRRRYIGGFTHISGAIRFANDLTLAAPFAAPRRVVDISGDGINTVGDSPQSARDAAVSSGLTINGLAITNAHSRLADYYRLTVIGGPEAFVIAAQDYDDYAQAIRQKLIREINLKFIL